MAFLIARTVLGSWVERMIASNERFSAVYGAMRVDSFRLAVLLRLAPFPSWANNYALAISPISFRDFFFATLVASMPMIAVNVYTGSFLGSLTMYEGQPASWTHYALGFVGLIAAVVAVKAIVGYVQLSLQQSSATQKHPREDVF